MPEHAQKCENTILCQVYFETNRFPPKSFRILTLIDNASWSKCILVQLMNSLGQFKKSKGTLPTLENYLEPN